MHKSSSTKRATLVDVARAAGVGPMTVSRTINGHPYVSKETAKKVQAAIQKLGYRPNQAARMLSGQLSKSIGLIVPAVSDRFFSVVSHAVQQTAREAGYVVWLAVSDGDPVVEEAQIEQMTNHPVDGILIVPANSRAKHLKAAVAGSTPIVTIDRPIEIASTDSVVVENRDGARMAVEHLIDHGWKRIVCVATDFHLSSIKLRVASYEESMRRARLPCKKLVLRSSSDILPAMKAIFKSSQPPDALFATNNMCTTGVIQALQTLKVRVPVDVALIGFDDVDFYTMLAPPVTTVSQPVSELGHISARLLLNKIHNKPVSSGVRVVLPVTLVVRESCGCKRH